MNMKNMEREKVWLRSQVWRGMESVLPCVVHTYRWNGQESVCMFCGKPEKKALLSMANVSGGGFQSLELY